MSKTGPKPKGGTTYVHTAAELDEIERHVLVSGDLGMSRADMLAVMPMAAHRMKWLLALLAVQRRVAPVGWTRWTRYYSPAAARRVLLAQREADAAKASADDCGALARELLPFRRVIVPANKAMPLMPAGPRSVFELVRAAA